MGKRLTLDFGSGRDLTAGEYEPCMRLWADREEPTWDSLSRSLSASPPLVHVNVCSLSQVNKHLKTTTARGTWVAQSIEHPTSTQVMILQFVGSSPASSVLTAQSLESASDSVSPSLSAPSTTPPAYLSLSTINKH